MPWGGFLKQLFRLFIQPATFVNQLQWSTNHGLILLIFLGIAVVESQVGAGRVLNLQLSWLLSHWTGWERDQALFAVMAARVGFLFFGALSLAETIWWIGDKLGRSTSKRVLSRRMAVVLTVMLASYSLFASVEPALQWAGVAVFSWGLVLTYLTLKEQFSLSALTAGVCGLVAAAMIMVSWQVSDKVVQKATGYAIADQIARAKPAPRAHHTVRPRARRRH